MNPEYQNAFDRKANANPADDRLNKFQRHDRLRAKQRVASDTQSDRIERNKQQRAAWVGPGRSDVRTAAGVKFTPDLQELKQAADAAPQSLITNPSEEDLAAFTKYFAETEPRYFPDEMNGWNLWNAMLDAVAQGKLTWGIPGLRTMFRWLLKNGYLSEIVQPGTRGIAHASRPAQKVYPVFVSAEERQRQQHNMTIAEQILDTEDARRAKAMPFDELQKQVRDENKHYGSRQEPI